MKARRQDGFLQGITRVKLSDALATIALLVATASAIFTYVQMKAANSQLTLTDLQVRPYVRFRPLFDVKRGDQLSVTEVIENFSSVPAHVIYSSLTPWVGGVGGLYLRYRSLD
jgi:hypothetical protein